VREAGRWVKAQRLEASGGMFFIKNKNPRVTVDDFLSKS
jgi:hypothetical protein